MTRIFQLLTAALLLMGAAYCAWAYPSLPDTIPTRFSLGGATASRSPKYTLWVLWTIGVSTSLVLAYAGRARAAARALMSAVGLATATLTTLLLYVLTEAGWAGGLDENLNATGLVAVVVYLVAVIILVARYALANERALRSVKA